jgi:hypothetical protein
LDALYIRFVVLPVRIVAKRFTPLILDRTLALWCCGIGPAERNRPEEMDIPHTVCLHSLMVSTSTLMFVEPDIHVVNPKARKR